MGCGEVMKEAIEISGCQESGTSLLEYLILICLISLAAISSIDSLTQELAKSMHASACAMESGGGSCTTTNDTGNPITPNPAGPPASGPPSPIANPPNPGT